MFFFWVDSNEVKADLLDIPFQHGMQANMSSDAALKLSL